MSDLIVSVSGLRGVVGETLTPEVASRYVAALASHAPPGEIVLARDGRTTGPMLVDAIRAALRACGRDVLDADVAATPTVGVLVRHVQAAGAVQVSASHNPPQYNGIKLFGHDGRVINAAAGAAVGRTFHELTTGTAAPPWREWDEIGGARRHSDPHAAHLAAVLAIVDVPRIQAARFRVLLDANHGAGALLGRRLLTALGCQTTVLGAEPNGHFLHKPEPTAENLQPVGAAVVESKAMLGFCQDPDADRLALIDAEGRYVGEEYTLALCLDHVLPRLQGPVVINCATSRMAADLAQRQRVPCHRSAVGEANVADMMLATGAAFGGEGNGGPIDPRVGLVRDSFVGMALILDALAARGGSLAEWAETLPRYAIHKAQARVPRDRIPAAMDRLERHFADASASRLDGLRLDWDDRWLLLRASNTEPLVRAIAEAPTPAAAIELTDQAIACL